MAHGSVPPRLRLVRSEPLLRPLDQPTERLPSPTLRGMVVMAWMFWSMPLIIIAVLTAPNQPFAWGSVVVSCGSFSWIAARYMLGRDRS